MRPAVSVVIPTYQRRELARRAVVSVLAREASCSLLEAIECCERVAGRALGWSYDERGRTGDHAWWISDTSTFRAEYPEWSVRRSLESIVEEIHAARRGRWPVEPAPG